MLRNNQGYVILLICIFIYEIINIFNKIIRYFKIINLYLNKKIKKVILF